MKKWFALVPALVLIVIISGCIQERATGIIRECDEWACGKCLCLEDDEGCHIINTNEIDLEYAINKTVSYTGEKGGFGTKTCPYYIKISDVKIVS
jgi:hypothetical protein